VQVKAQDVRGPRATKDGEQRRHDEPKLPSSGTGQVIRTRMIVLEWQTWRIVQGKRPDMLRGGCRWQR
jgi:hypothetical protein